MLGPADTVVSELLIGTLNMFNSLRLVSSVGNPNSVNPELITGSL
jgi:hypothetical protein